MPISAHVYPVRLDFERFQHRSRSRTVNAFPQVKATHKSFGSVTRHDGRAWRSLSRREGPYLARSTSRLDWRYFGEGKCEVRKIIGETSTGGGRRSTIEEQSSQDARRRNVYYVDGRVACRWHRYIDARYNMLHSPIYVGYLHIPSKIYRLVLKGQSD